VEDTAVIVNGASPVSFAGLTAVRITWITAIAVCVLAILSGLRSGADGGGSSLQFPGFAFADSGDDPQLLPELPLPHPVATVGGEAQKTKGKRKAAAPEGDGRQWAREQTPGESQSRAHVPNRSGSRPDNAGGRGPAGTGGPSSQAPSLKPPKLPKEPALELPKAPKEPSLNPPRLPKEPALKPPKELSLKPPKLPKEPSIARPSSSPAPSGTAPSSSSQTSSVSLASAPSTVQEPSGDSVTSALPVEVSVSETIQAPETSVDVPDAGVSLP
jgi:hypothetical protein